MFNHMLVSERFLLILLPVLLLQIISPVWSAKILFVAPFESQSQCLFMTPYIEALAERGHDLTVLHTYPQCKALKNVKYIFVDPHPDSYPGWDGVFFSGLYSKWIEVTSMRSFMFRVCVHILENVHVKTLLRSKVTFDLVIIEASHTDCLFGLAHHFNATLVGLSSCGSDWNLDTLIGYTASSIYEPIFPMGLRPVKTIMDRFYNWFYLTEEWLLLHLLYLPKLRLVHEHFFGHLDRDFMEIRQNFALILLNQHFSIYPARANIPKMVEIAGIHLPKTNPTLPSDLAEFIDGSEHGVIYIALGIEMQSKDLPESTLRMLFNVFQSLPQRVIWKFEGQPPPNVGENIYLDKWLPQMAILAHPNVKVFISHAGMLSIIETIYFGKPVIGLPLFYDQFRNMKRLVEEGMGKVLNLNTMTGEDVQNALNEILYQQEYHLNALALSERFRDQPMHPLDTAVYWTEYILRHKGAPHMRVSLANMKFIDYYCLDKLLIISVRLSAIVAILYFVLLKSKWLFRRLMKIYTVICFSISHQIAR